MKRLLLTLVLLLGAYTAAVAGDFEDGMARYNRKEYATAVEKWTKAAEAGVAMAQYNLALMYENGQGAPQDDTQAAHWYTKAAEAGVVKAQYTLALRYYNGRGVPQDFAQAAGWYTKAAEAGVAMAQHNLALMYENGQGVPQDNEQAHKWYSSAATIQTDNVERDKAASGRDRVAEKLKARRLVEALKLAETLKLAEARRLADEQAARVARQIVAPPPSQPIPDTPVAPPTARTENTSHLRKTTMDALLDASLLSWWGIIGVGLITVVVALLIQLTGVKGFARLVLLGLAVGGPWYPYLNLSINPGPVLRDTALAPILGPRAPVERLGDQMGAKLLENPDVRRELRGAPIHKRLAKLEQLVNQGMYGLSDASQTRFLQLLIKILETAQDSECASLMKGDSRSTENEMRILNRRTEAELREYYELTAESVIAAVAHPPAASPRAQSLNTILESLRFRLTGSEQMRFQTAAQTVFIRKGVTDACWMGKIIYVFIVGLPHEGRSEVLQALAQPDDK